MKALLYKELKLAIHPGFYLILLFGALILIPQWLYFIAMMYFFFIAVPNIFSTCKAQNDVSFSVMLPVRKRDVVKARFASIIFMELLQIIVAAIFAVINLRIYTVKNFMLEPNAAFFGFVFVMYAVFNAVFFPMFYKTAYKIGAPVIWATVAAVLFATIVEFCVLFFPAASAYLDVRKNMINLLPVLAGGIVIFVLVNYLAFRVSVERFEKIDL